MKRKVFDKVVLAAGITMAICLVSYTKTASANQGGYRGCLDGNVCHPNGDVGFCGFVPNGGSGYCGCNDGGGAPTGTYACAGGQ